MDISSLLDEPLNLNKESLKLIFKNHESSESSFFKRARYEESEKELFKFFYNYFNFGLPIFELDTLETKTNSVIYVQNPVDWLNQISNEKIEVTLCFFYFKKYIRDNFKDRQVSLKAIERLNQALIISTKKCNYHEVIVNVHEVINKYLNYLKSQGIEKEYGFKNYMQSRDLNCLFNMCYNMYLKEKKVSSIDNTFNGLSVNSFI